MTRPELSFFVCETSTTTIDNFEYGTIIRTGITYKKIPL